MPHLCSVSVPQVFHLAIILHIFPVYAVFTQLSNKREMSISKANGRHSTWTVGYNQTLKPKKDYLYFKEKEQNHLIFDVLLVWTVHSFTMLSQRSRDNLLGDH